MWKSHVILTIVLLIIVLIVTLLINQQIASAHQACYSSLAESSEPGSSPTQSSNSIVDSISFINCLELNKYETEEDRRNKTKLDVGYIFKHTPCVIKDDGALYNKSANDWNNFFERFKDNKRNIDIINDIEALRRNSDGFNYDEPVAVTRNGNKKKKIEKNIEKSQKIPVEDCSQLLIDDNGNLLDPTEPEKVSQVSLQRLAKSIRGVNIIEYNPKNYSLSEEQKLIETKEYCSCTRDANTNKVFGTFNQFHFQSSRSI